MLSLMCQALCANKTVPAEVVIICYFGSGGFAFCRSLMGKKHTDSRESVFKNIQLYNFVKDVTKLCENIN